MLRTTINPAEADPKHVEDVVSHYDKTFRPIAKERGKEDAFNSELSSIRTNHRSWNDAVNHYAAHHNYDIVHHADTEIVVRNPKAVRYLGKHKA